mgnify:CR=1 FL=1
MAHEFLCRGARVRVHPDGRVEVLDEPAVCYCPYVEAVYGVRRIDKRAVERIVRMKVEKFGFCRPSRCFIEKLVVPFGSSEMISVCMREGLLDCAVTVCEGAGTVIAWEPELVQGIGAMLTGILRTSPIEEVLSHVEQHGGVALSPEEAKIDQVEGVRRAIEMGFKRIAVTVIGPRAHEIAGIRALEKAREGVRVAIFSTCNTLVREEDLPFLEQADVVCSSASRLIRERIGPKALMQLGVSIPVFILTQLGKELALEYLKHVRATLVVFRARMPYIVEEKQPVLVEGRR